MKKLYILLVLLFTLGFASPAMADPFPIIKDSDDNNNRIVRLEIRAEEYSAPITQAVTEWNRLYFEHGERGVFTKIVTDSPEVVVIAPDCGGIAYVQHRDMNVDTLALCRAYQSESYSWQVYDGLHELGHTLGLGHPTPCSEYEAESVMVTNCYDLRVTLGTHDERHWERRWIN